MPLAPEAQAATRKLGRQGGVSEPALCLTKSLASQRRKAAGTAKRKKVEKEGEVQYVEYEEEVEEWVSPKDPNKPKRAMTSYICFTRERRAPLIAEQPELASKMVELTKLMATEWQAMDVTARQPFIALNEADKERYDAEILAYVPPPKVRVMKTVKKQKVAEEPAKAAPTIDEGHTKAKVPNSPLGFSIWGKGRNELGPTDAESAGANQAESAVVGKPNSRRPAKYLRQKAADLESDDSAEEEDTSSPVFRGASSAPVENIWKAASKAQKPSAKNTKKLKKTKETNPVAKRPRPEGSRTSSRTKRVTNEERSPVFSDAEIQPAAG